MDYSKHVSTRKTSQRERTLGRTDEIENSEGGFVFGVSDWNRLDRFLILGSEGGSYYIKERDLTKQNADATLKLIKADGVSVVNRVVAVSDEGRAHKNDAALFVLAMCAKLGNDETKRAAYLALPKVARIGTHLFAFVKFCEAFGGWGAGLRRAIARWYNQKDADKLAVQLLKYRQRDGWSHRDLLRLAHPVTTSEKHASMFDVTAHPAKLESLLIALPNIYSGFEKASRLAANPDVALIEQYGLSWEMLPTEWLNDVEVNTALLKNMPLMATIRQLGKLTANGTLKPLSETTKLVVARLTDQEQIAKSRIHPMHYLLAVKNYAAGKGFRGGLAWKTDGRIIDALNDGFYKSFANVVPTGKAFMLGIDVSSSMSSPMADSNISCAEAAGAMAMVIARTEESHYMHGFTGGRGYGSNGGVDGFIDLGISSKDSLDSVMKKVQLRNFGTTDCAVPMLYASKHKLCVDTFVVITDNETWAGHTKPVDALRQYRREYNKNAKLVVIGMTANEFTIADPTDAGMLDVVGFDASVLPVIQEFSK